MNTWRVQWQHRTDSSSWWSDAIVRAETAEEAAGKQAHLIDEHTRVYDRRLRVRVYGPLPEDYEEFLVEKAVKVEKQGTGAG